MIDVGSALRQAIVDCCGDRALIHRCQEHKRRNVIEYLSEEPHASVGRALRDAWGGANAALAAKQLQRLAASLQAKHPWALTVRCTAGCARPTRQETLNGSITHFTRDVRRWKDSAMTLRWVAGALADAKQRLRKLHGRRDMRGPLAALQAHTECATDAELGAA